MHPKGAKRVNTRLACMDLDPLWTLAHAYLCASATCSKRYPSFSKLIQSRDIKGILSMTEPSPSEHWEDPDDYLECAQLFALFKKFPFTKEESGLSPELTAFQTFSRFERKCSLMNRAFLLRKKHGYRVKSPDRAQSYAFILEDMRRTIQRVLGEAPKHVEILEHCDFTTGASIGVHGDKTNIGRKLDASFYSCTPSALTYAVLAIWRNLHLRFAVGGSLIDSFDVFTTRLKEKSRYVRNNKLAFVPKTAKTDRSIAVEPLLNVFVQKGIDTWMRTRLCKIGIDLRDQVANQVAARVGSKEALRWATIDLSSASDSISIGLVKDLLPSSWYYFLDEVRSPCYEYRGTVSRYHKFVTMGNGFCFPLQTLIFSAACLAVLKECGVDDPIGGRDFLVYGDDILIDSMYALRVLELLKYLGFSANVGKTNIVGPFRESCGTDWLEGQAVRPVFVKRRFRSVQDLMALHNTCISKGNRALASAASCLIRYCPKNLRFYRPFHYVDSGDGAFVLPLDTCMASRFISWDRESWAWRWSELLYRPVFDFWNSSNYEWLSYIAFLRGSPATRSGLTLTFRRKTRAQVLSISTWGDEVILPSSLPRGGKGRNAP